MKTKVLILGAGPAGITLANKLHQSGFDDFLVLEKENESGGLCRSKIIDGFPLDIGGGHFLDVRRPKVNEFLFGFMPENEWNKFNRDSRIAINNKYISHPIEANIWQMDRNEQVEYLKSIAIAGCNLGQKMPENFVDWIYWKLGKRIADDYMIPYNQKMFSDELNFLGTYWLEKLPNVSFEETLLSCLEHKMYGEQPGHAQFYYPKNYGYGELWNRMAKSVQKNILYHSSVCSIDFNLLKVVCENGKEIAADCIVTTIPWNEFKKIYGMPDDIRKSISNLKHSSIETRYYNTNIVSSAHWIYYPDTSLPYHRILLRHNFAEGSRGYWTETRTERVNMFEEEENYRYVNTYAYPINTIDKPQIMSNLLKWSESKNVFGLGRWGEHQHYNSDLTVELAINLSERLIKEWQRK